MRYKRFIPFMAFLVLMLLSMPVFAGDVNTAETPLAAAVEAQTVSVTVNGVEQEIEISVPVYNNDTFSTSFDSDIKAYFENEGYSTLAGLFILSGDSGVWSATEDSGDSVLNAYSIAVVRTLPKMSVTGDFADINPDYVMKVRYSIPLNTDTGVISGDNLLEFYPDGLAAVSEDGNVYTQAAGTATFLDATGKSVLTDAMVMQIAGGALGTAAGDGVTQYYDGYILMHMEEQEEDEAPYRPVIVVKRAQITGTSSVQINEANFPDEVFREYVMNNFDTDSDGMLSEEEIAAVTSIGGSVGNSGISSLKGVEYFTALTYLNCSYNKLTALDVSNNIALTELHCENNQLTALDVGECSALTELHCGNNQLAELDVSHNDALTVLDCWGSRLNALDLSNNRALTELYCGKSNLAALDLSNNTALTILLCNYSRLTELDISHNTALKELDIGSNDLTALDVSNNTALTWLVFGDNRLTELDVSRNTALEYLDCSTNCLASLDLSNNTSLEELDADSQTPTLLCGTSSVSGWPYMLTFYDNLENVLDINIRDSSGGIVNYSEDKAGGILYFSSMPAEISYSYNTHAPVDNPKMTVNATINFSNPGSDPGENSNQGSNSGKYSFAVPSGVRSRLEQIFGSTEIYQFTDDEIISDTWELSDSDQQAVNSLNERVIINLPEVLPVNSGVYLLRVSLAEAETGRLINLYGITDSGNTVNSSALENTNYVFLDEDGNEIDRVPENGIIYAAMNLTANRNHKAVITSPAELERGTIQPIELTETLLEKVAETVNVSVDQIRYITEENISEPLEPTQAMRDEMESRQNEVIGKLNTLTVSEDGYYVFKVVLSEDLYKQIEGVSISQINVFMYALSDDELPEEAQVVASFLPGLLNTWELLTLSGEKLEFGAREFLMVGFLNAGTPFSVYLTKILLALLAGGCDTGLGLAGLAALTAAFFIFRRR